MDDYASWYNRISKPFRGERAAAMVRVLDKGLVALIAAVYLGSLVALAVAGDSRILRAALVPALLFAFVTVVRARIDAPRPYEVCDIDPLIPKDTRGHSMPSRHLASAVVIACALTWLYGAWGAFAFAACTVVAFTRIVGGVHFPRDVVAAAAIAAVFGAVGFALIP